MATTTSKTSTIAFGDLRRDIRQGRLKPVYLLHGEEGYFIDELLKDFEKVIPDGERDFNMFTIYGPESSPEQIAEACRRFPMMAERQVVIVKEGQALSAAEMDRLAPYVASPTASTVLVVSVRGVEAKGARFKKAVKDGGGVVFESKKLKEGSVATVIKGLVKEKKLTIEDKGLAMLQEYVGTDVARLYNEIDKLAMILGQGALVTPEAIEQNVGVSKDYNNFELQDAIVARDGGKAMRIVKYFESNPKKNSAIMSIAVLFSLFSGLACYQFCRDRSQAALMVAVGVKSPYQLRKYEQASRSYNAYQTLEIITALRRADAAAKGVGSRMNEWDILYTLIYKILNAKGEIAI